MALLQVKMMSDEKRQLEVSSDEDWKDKVKAEAAELDAQGVTAKKAADTPTVEQMPPADFMSLVQMFSTQAVVTMGLIPDPEGNTRRHLPLAKHFIDLLGVLEVKTKENLTVDEQRLLNSTLHELRMTYAQVKNLPEPE